MPRRDFFPHGFIVLRTVNRKADARVDRHLQPCFCLDLIALDIDYLSKLSPSLPQAAVPDPVSDDLHGLAIREILDFGIQSV
jgi:hypothetical protein